MGTAYDTLMSPLGIQHVVKAKPYRDDKGIRKPGDFLCGGSFRGGRYIEVQIDTNISGLCPKCAERLKEKIETEKNRQRLQEEQERLAEAELPF